MAGTTCIRNAQWVIAWDAEAARHAYMRDADVAFTGATIDFVGRGYEGAVETEIDGRGLLVMPGLIDVHSHPSSEPKSKGLFEELGSPLLYNTTLIEYMPLMATDDVEALAAATEVALAELLLSGCTTVVDLSAAWPGWLDLLARSGLRAYAAPMYRSARWFTPNGHDVLYEWDEAAGLHGLEQALAVVEAARAHACGRLDGMLAPAQVDTCSPTLLRKTMAAAREHDLAVQIHASQSVVEFREMVRRHGQTPLAWLDGLGVLGPRTTIAHAIFLDHHSWLHWPEAHDLERLADSGAHVAHCPNIFARRGMLLEDLAAYRALGITVGLGTDSFPHNMIDEMRWATVLTKVATSNVHALGVGDVLDVATTGGARILGRDDIGRLSPGARADIVLVDATQPAMRPLRDPLRSLVFSALERPVREVYVDGTRVVADGRVLTLDLADAVARVEQAQARLLAEVPTRDWAHRDADAAFPRALPILGD